MIERLQKTCIDTYKDAIKFEQVSTTKYEIHIQPITLSNPNEVQIELSSYPSNPQIEFVKKSSLPQDKVQKYSAELYDAIQQQDQQRMMSVFNAIMLDVQSAVPPLNNTDQQVPGVRMSFIQSATDAHPQTASQQFFANNSLIQTGVSSVGALAPVLSALSSSHHHNQNAVSYLIQYLIAHQQVRSGPENYYVLQEELMESGIISFRVPYDTFYDSHTMRSMLADLAIPEQFRSSLSKTVTRLCQSKFKIYGEQFDEVRLLGSGAFGEVWLVRQKIDEREYAIKKLMLPGDEETIGAVLGEIRTLLKLQSQYVVQYYNAWVEVVVEEINGEQTDYFMTARNVTFSVFKMKTHDYVYEEVTEEEPEHTQNSDVFGTLNQGFQPEPQESIKSKLTKESESTNYPSKQMLFIQMEVCPNKTLAELIYDRNNTLTDEIRWKLTMQMISGLSYIHNLQVVHRDIKPENIFLTHNLDIKYGDFGIAINYVNQKMMGVAGTRIYMAPEATGFLTQQQLRKTDVYALGLTFFELWCSKAVDSRKNEFDSLKTQMRNQGECSSLIQLSLKNEAAYKLICMMCQPNADQRASIVQIMQYKPIFDRLNVSSILQQLQDDIADDKKQLRSKLLETLVQVTPAIQIPEVDYDTSKIFDLKDAICEDFQRNQGFELQEYEQLMYYTVGLRPLAAYLEPFKVVGQSKYVRINAIQFPIFYYISQDLQGKYLYQYVHENEPYVALVFLKNDVLLVQLLEDIIRLLKQSKQHKQASVFYCSGSKQILQSNEIQIKQFTGDKQFDGFQEAYSEVQVKKYTGSEIVSWGGQCCGIYQLNLRIRMFE